MNNKPSFGRLAARIITVILTIVVMRIPATLIKRAEEKRQDEAFERFLPKMPDPGFYLDEEAGSTGEFLTATEVNRLQEKELLEKAGTETSIIFKGGTVASIAGRKVVPVTDVLDPTSTVLLLSEEELPSPGEGLYIKAECLLRGYCIPDRQYETFYTGDYPVLEITGITTGDFFSLDCPALETVTPSVEAVEEGVRVELTKIEYGEKYARIYLTLENLEDRVLGVADSEYLCDGKELEKMEWSEFYLKAAGLPVLTFLFAGEESRQEVIITAEPLDPESRLEFSYDFVTGSVINKKGGYTTLDEPVCTIRLVYDPET